MMKRYEMETHYGVNIKVEEDDSIVNLLETAAIYLRDPECNSVKIWDLETKQQILNYEERM